MTLPTLKMPPPDSDIMAIRRYCEQRVPPDAADDLRIEADVHRLGVDVVECRPPWRPGPDATWTRLPVARLRWVAEDERWQLQWLSSSDRWHAYDGIGPTRDVLPLLDELDRDPDGVFWG